MLKMIYCKETERFQTLFTQNQNEIKEMDEKLDALISKQNNVIKKNGYTHFTFLKSGVTIPEYEILQNEINKVLEKREALELNSKVILVACDFKINQLKKNILNDYMNVLETLKMRDIVNFTDIRKEKVKKELLKLNSFSDENRIYLYKDSYCFGLHLSNSKYPSWNCDLEITAYDFDFEHKKEKVEILPDKNYLEIADDFVTKRETLRKKIESFNKNIKSEVETLEKKYKNFGACVYLDKYAHMEEL